MSGVAIIGILLGSVIGLRFRVFAIFPVIGLVFIIAAHGFAAGNSTWTIVLAGIVTAVSIQLGYFAGSAASFLFSRKIPVPASLASEK
jgi:hypothetical protein